MAEPLKNSFGRDIPTRIAAMVQRIYPEFQAEAFVDVCLRGYDRLELTPRARQISDGLAAFLPEDRAAAVEIVTACAAAPIGDELTGMDGFRYLPFVFFVADHGLDHFEEAMTAQYELTKRFTAEFSIRAFLERYPDATLERLDLWATDPNVHVRRLVSEGTRPRLPWAPRLTAFQNDPTPVLRLLDVLKDDPEEYVRRSVANNLNDIAKDHPDLVVRVAEQWWSQNDRNRQRLIRHGLRTLIKNGDPGALRVLGYDANTKAEVRSGSIIPQTVAIGGKVRIDVDVANPTGDDTPVLVDLVVHFVKANGSTSPKVFKGTELRLAPYQADSVGKSISVGQHTTRTHYPGTHRVDVVLNGTATPIGSFELTE